jgi:beta-phosphoglucomutase
MKWIHNYQLFLFDFDGLLVNTEEIHYLAYKNMFHGRGVNFSWDFNRYCQAAHYDAHALKNQMYAEFPQLHTLEPNWEVLYAEKKKALHKLLEQGAVHLMPGAAKMLQALQQANIPRAVVTHSPEDVVQLIRRKNPLLDTIPSWITREHYSHPKPNPECYLKAIELLAKPGDRVVAFEDTPRGLTAILGTSAKPVLICSAQYPEIPSFVQRGVVHYSSFESIPDDKLK